jgi:hypothetical protein
MLKSGYESCLFFYGIRRFDALWSNLIHVILPSRILAFEASLLLYLHMLMKHDCRTLHVSAVKVRIRGRLCSRGADQCLHDSSFLHAPWTITHVGVAL